MAIGILLFLIGATLNTWSKKIPEKEKRKPETAVVSEVKDGIEVTSGLISASGIEIVKRRCLTCHSSKLITQTRLSRENWEEKIRWMQATQNLGDLGMDEKPILDYLALNYAPVKRGRRPQLKKTEWYWLEK